jgi:hypothetical protein
MRNPWFVPLLIIFAALVLVEPALAQAPPAGNNYNVSWAALNPGNDWAAQVIQSLLPIGGTTAAPGTSPPASWERSLAPSLPTPRS